MSDATKKYFDCPYQSGAVFENINNSLDTLVLFHSYRGRNIGSHISDGKDVDPQELITNRFSLSDKYFLSIDIFAEGRSDAVHVSISDGNYPGFSIYNQFTVTPEYPYGGIDTSYQIKSIVYKDVKSLQTDSTQMRFAPGVGLIQFYEKSDNKVISYVLRSK